MTIVLVKAKNTKAAAGNYSAAAFVLPVKEPGLSF
jgi:hypothetical protein